ncbi:MAG: tyrosine-type recombinase/integrase [Phycisphaerae bacterium]|nr:tyrosine-type recombinase/integrase [Phycisphaerae bacterium]
MPKLIRKLPSYRHHKASGQAVVTLSGRDHYLGPYGSAESHAEYKRLIAEWLSAGQQSPASFARHEPDKRDVRIDELLLAYLHFAEGYYVKNGRPTCEVTNIKHAMEPLASLYGRMPIAGFGPAHLKTVRQRMIDADLSRKVINARVNRLRRVFKWGVENELVEPPVLLALQAVAPLRNGRTKARETRPVSPVPEASVEAVLPLVTRPVRAMIELQRLTGMRPGEVIQMRPCDLDMSGSIWEYRPASHKTEHHGLDRVVFIGPRAQKVLRPFLRRNVRSHLFSPREAVRDAWCRQTLNAKNKPRASKRKARPKKQPGWRYTTKSYCYAIHKACKKAGVACWGPNRLRHYAATFLRRRYGIEAARVILGHQSVGITEVYAEMDRAAAADIMSQVG